MIEIDYKMPLNLGNPGEFEVIELANLVKEMTASKSKIKFLPLPEDDPKQRKPDISKVRKLLGWQPEADLKQGLKKTINYFERIIS